MQVGLSRLPSLEIASIRKIASLSVGDVRLFARRDGAETRKISGYITKHNAKLERDGFNRKLFATCTAVVVVDSKMDESVQAVKVVVVKRVS